ncbi:hypothetical protein ACFL06_00235 [Patescibacteria group bacterium]
MKIFLIFILGGLVFIPGFSLAAGTYQADGNTVCYEGLVPCGGTLYLGVDPVDGKCQDTGTNVITDITQTRCKLCHFIVMADGIIDYILLVLVPITAVLMLVVGGIMFFFAGGNPQVLEQSKAIITSVVKGLVIIFVAWIIINTFFSIIGVAEWTGFVDDPSTAQREGWFSINCPISIQP